MFSTGDAEEPDDLLLFTPVALTWAAAGGWSSEVQRAFIAVLARTGVVAAAARSVGRSARSAYLLRRREGAEGFARAWDRALGEGQQRALDTAMTALETPQRLPVFYRGRQVGWRTRYDNRVVYAALRALDGVSGRFASGSRNDRAPTRNETAEAPRNVRTDASPPPPPRDP